MQKVGHQQIPVVTGNLALEYKMRLGRGYQSIAKIMHWS